MKIVYYLEVVSSWCHWVEPVWAELQRRYAGRVEFQWQIALMPPEAFPTSQAQCDWFYRRSGTIMRSPYKLNSGWHSSGPQNYDAPNLVAEAGRDFGIEDDRLRLALSHAAVRLGLKVGDMTDSVAAASTALGLDPVKLRARAESPEVRARVDASTTEFLSHRIDQRPAFILTNTIGDKAVFSGLVRLDPIAATLDAMLADTAAYASYAAHFGAPPAH